MKEAKVSYVFLNRFTCCYSTERKVKDMVKRKKPHRISMSFFPTSVCYCRLHNNIHLPHLIKNLIRSYCSNANVSSDSKNFILFFSRALSLQNADNVYLFNSHYSLIGFWLVCHVIRSKHFIYRMRSDMRDDHDVSQQHRNDFTRQLWRKKREISE